MSISIVKARVRGQEVELRLNSQTGMYEGELTAPGESSFPESEHFFGVTLTATDSFGNTSTADTTHSVIGENLKLVVKERIPPIVTITAPSNGSYLTSTTPTITFTVTDNTILTEGFSDVKLDSAVVLVNGNTENNISWSGENGSYVGTVTLAEPLINGQNLINIKVSDNDGNESETAVSDFIVDTVAPTLTVSTPNDGLETNQRNITVSGVTDDQTSKPVTVTIKVNGKDQGEVTVNSDGSFSKEITNSLSGMSQIVITATDRAGKTTEVIKTVYYSTTAPIFESVTINPNPTDCGTLYKISVVVR